MARSSPSLPRASAAAARTRPSTSSRSLRRGSSACGPRTAAKVERKATQDQVDRATEWLRQRLADGPVGSVLCAREGDKAIGRMFREGIDGFKGGMSAEKYIAITGASRATATRDLGDLAAKGALTRTGERRHTRYHLRLTE